MPKLKGLFVYPLLLLCCFKVQAQQKTTTVALFYEKVFLHTDRDVYAQGDDVWFKAYLLNAQNNQPIGYSYNLYVELIGPGLNIVASQTLRLQNGLANGDFKLRDTLSAGTYRMRAYTNWMRNFGDKFIFEKNITVISTGDKIPVAAVAAQPVKRFKKKPNLNGIKDTLPPGPLVQFFPEGGYLVNDVRSVVGFKAEDELGRSIAVSGNVMASSGRVVAKFACDSTGMGVFTMRPDDSQKYHAELIIKGKPYSFNVGRPLHKGFVLSVNTVAGTIVADVSCNGFTLGEAGGSDLVIVGQHGGKTCYKQKITINSKNALVTILDTNFPEGIASVTIFNEFGKPIAERLVYVHHTDNTRLTVSTDKRFYQPKEKVTVTIKLSDTTASHLSLAAVDAGLVPVQAGDIVSYLTLRSELTGAIAHPERYFDTTNVNRFKQLDALLLTQGWRSYVWQRIADSIPNIKYDVEQGITLTGHVRKLFSKQTMPNMSITMFAPKAQGQKLFSATTDSLGKFTMDGAVFYGYQFINFTSRDAYKMKNGEAKGHSGGWIQVDSLFQDKLPVLAAAEAGDTTAIKTDSLIEKVRKRKKFTFSGINELKTVQIKARTDAPPPEVHTIGQAEQKDYGSLMHYLLYMIPGAHEEQAKCDCNGADLPILEFSQFPSYHIPITGIYSDHSYINYKTLCPDDYLDQPMTNVYKVTIFRSYRGAHLNISVFVILKPGVLEHTSFDNAIADVTGYYKARNFYTPRYDTPSDKSDYRTTIHWEPAISTNVSGQASLSFYNADPKTKIRLIVQGVTDKGLPLAAVAEYEVK